MQTWIRMTAWQGKNNIANIKYYEICVRYLLSYSPPAPPASFSISFHSNLFLSPIVIENRVYREEFTGKKCKTAILLYCFHFAGVLHIFMLYNLLGPGTSFYRKSKIIVKRKPNYEIGWLHNWPMIISHRLYAFHFTNDDFPL